MKGFSVFSALIGTIVFIIAILLITLYVRSDIILKTDSITTEENNKLEGVAAITNVVFQASTILEIRNKTDKFFETFDVNKGSITINLGELTQWDSEKDIENKIYDIIDREYNMDTTKSKIKTEISKQIIKTVLGQANFGGDATKSFEESFDLELDSKNNKVKIKIIKPVDLKIDQKGVKKEYHFTLTSGEVYLSWNIKEGVKEFSEKLYKIIENISQLKDKTLASANCKCILHKKHCCISYSCGKDGNSCCPSKECSYCTQEDSGYLINIIYMKKKNINRNTCPKISNDYNDNKFKKELKEKIEKYDKSKNLNILLGTPNVEKVINKSTKKDYKCKCGGGCGSPVCIGNGDKERYYKIKGFTVSIPMKMKICDKKQKNKCMYLKVFAKIKI